MDVISAKEIEEKVCQLLKRANFYLPKDVYGALTHSLTMEDFVTAKAILNILLENAAIAQSESVPICQDTGIDVVFVEIGQELRIDGDLYEAINRGVARGTKEGYLRASVCDAISRENSGDNTPAVVHVQLMRGAGLAITVLPKGCGSENMSRLKMLPPASGLEGVEDFVVECVKKAGPNPCPPGIIGVGIGGTMELSAILSKKALCRPIGSRNQEKAISDLETRLLERINRLGIGPQGLGGGTTSLSVAVETHPCHIASLPVAVNIQCHAARRSTIFYENGRWMEKDEATLISSTKDQGLSSLLEDAVRLSLPLSKADVMNLRAGQWVLITGRLLTARDQTHRRLCELIKQKQGLPVDLDGQLIYYVGPSPAPPGKVVGAAGPTTSYRMDAYTPKLLEKGVLGLMGKGKRSEEVRAAIQAHGAVYLSTIGGAGAYLSRAIKDARIIAFEDLGPEALYEFYVEDFPAVVINDSTGQDYYEMVQDESKVNL